MKKLFWMWNLWKDILKRIITCIGRQNFIKIGLCLVVQSFIWKKACKNYDQPVICSINITLHQLAASIEKSGEKLWKNFSKIIFAVIYLVLYIANNIRKRKKP